MKSSRYRSLPGHKHMGESQGGGHIVQQSLNRKNQLIDKYQNQVQDLLQKIDQKHPRRKSVTNNSPQLSNLRNIKRNRLSSSYRNETNETEKQVMVSGSMRDYQKLILGLQYALESERKKSQTLGHRNSSLQLQISNLRNILVGPDQSKQYEKRILKQLQDKINQQEDKVLDQKKNYEFIIQSKNQAIASLQSQLRTLQKDHQSRLGDKQRGRGQSKQITLTKKILDLMNSLQQLRTSVTQKNILIESLKYKKIQFHADSGDQSDDQIKKIRKVEKVKFYQEQLQVSSKMIIRKNIQILNLSNKVIKLQEVMEVVQMYLDKKQVKNIDLNILQAPVITKLRILFRQKATFERQLLSQLNQHNKKIATFENKVISKQSLTSLKLAEVIADNKKLTLLVSSLQTNIKNLEKSLGQQKRENEYLGNQVQINKKQFIQEIKRLKGDLGTISSVTKNEFDRMKIQNLKLSQQNRSLLFLVGQKQRQLHKKGQTMKTFEDYKQKINSLEMNMSQVQRRKVDRISQQTPQIGSKMLLINNFSGWMFQWNKVKNWNNKKVLLNLVLHLFNQVARQRIDSC